MVSFSPVATGMSWIHLLCRHVRCDGCTRRPGHRLRTRAGGRDCRDRTGDAAAVAPLVLVASITDADSARAPLTHGTSEPLFQTHLELR